LCYWVWNFYNAYNSFFYMARQCLHMFNVPNHTEPEKKKKKKKNI
jgi:hypothetical protein